MDESYWEIIAPAIGLIMFLVGLVAFKTKGSALIFLGVIVFNLLAILFGIYKGWHALVFPVFIFLALASVALFVRKTMEGDLF